MKKALVRVGVMAGVTLAALWLTTATASAHDTVTVTIHSDGTGTVWTTLAWSDGHPVSEPATAIMLATTTDGRRVGPVGLRAVSGTPGVLSYASRLEAGQWRVTVDAATPGLGHCEADVTIGANPPGTPTETTCAVPPTPIAAPPAAPPSRGPWVTLLIVVGAAVAAALALVWRTPSKKNSRRS